MKIVPIVFLLEDMREHAALAVEFLEGRDDGAVERDLRTQLALFRAVEIVGEAASKLPLEWRTANDQVPWRRAINMRNILIHGYREIELPIVTTTVREEFPVLIAALEKLLAELDRP